MEKVELKAYAKINIGLDITGKREDGYHLLKSVMHQVDLYDIITIEKRADKGFEICSNSSDVPLDNTNLAYKCADMMFEKYSLAGGLIITIDKRIPVAAGMAGGSTDGAAVIKGINELFELGLTEKEMCEAGVSLGADIPFCIKGGCALCEGIGEKMRTIYTDVEMYALIVKPNLNVSTKFVYQNLHLDTVTHPDMDSVIQGFSEDNLSMITQYMGNVLESVTAKEYDIINILKGEIRETWPDGVLMSGSGPTVFGLYDNMNHALKAEAHLKELHPDIFVKAVGMIR